MDTDETIELINRAKRVGFRDGIFLASIAWIAAVCLILFMTALWSPR